MKRQVTSFLCLAAGAAALLLLSGAQAATGTTGRYDPVSATCFADYILVSSPSIEPSPATTGGFVVGPEHVQWVAFKPHIAVWVPGSGWQDAASGSWKAQKAATGVFIGDNSYYNLDTRRWEGGGTTFTVQPGHYFRAWAEYYWYADEQADQGYDTSWASYTYDYRTTNPASVEYCQY